MKKYEFTGEVKVKFGVTLKRIRAIIDFGNVKKGEIGGLIEKEENLSHENSAWIYGNAEVYGNARIYGNAEIYGSAEVYGNAEVYGDAWISGSARVSGSARIYGSADYMLIGRIGSRFGFTTFFKNKNKGVSVSCGCFSGTLAEFRKKVKETHGTDTKYAKVYQAAADLAEMQILDNEKADGVSASIVKQGGK